MQSIKDADFLDFIKGEKIVIVDFWAKWCLPCRMVGPMLEALSEDYTDSEVIFTKMDVDDNPDTAEKYQIMTIPTLAFFYKGQKIHEIQGARPKGAVKKEIEQIRKKVKTGISEFDIGIG